MSSQRDEDVMANKTTLPALIQQLRAAPIDSLTEIREAIAVVAEAVVATQPTTASDERLTNALATIERLRADVDKAQGQLVCSRAAHRRQYEDNERMLAELVKLGAEVNGLTAERDAALDDVARLTNERDAHFACAEQMTADRDRLAAEVKTIAETTEAALTKRIAAWLYDESSSLASMANTREANDRNQRSSALANVADALRAGTWKEPK